MINQQCYTVSEAIAVLQKHRKPDDVIIFDYLCAEDIQAFISEGWEEAPASVSKEQANQIMYVLDRFNFGIGSEYDTVETLNALLTDIKEEIAAILNVPAK